MKLEKLIFLSFAVLGLFTSCSGTSHLSVNNPSQQTYLIPAQTQSCYAKTQATSGTTITYDVSAKYFELQGVTISWNDPNTTLYVAVIYLKFMVPSTNTLYTCTIAGNELLATNVLTPPAGWNATGIATVGPNSTVALTCPITCGGVTTATTDGNGNSVDVGFTNSASMEVIGFAQDASLHQTPASITSYFDVINIAQ